MGRLPPVEPVLPMAPPFTQVLLLFPMSGVPVSTFTTWPVFRYPPPLPAMTMGRLFRLWVGPSESSGSHMTALLSRSLPPPSLMLSSRPTSFAYLPAYHLSICRIMSSTPVTPHCPPTEKSPVRCERPWCSFVCMMPSQLNVTYPG